MPRKKKPTEQEAQEITNSEPAAAENEETLFPFSLKALEPYAPYLQESSDIMPYFRKAVEEYKKTHDISGITLADTLKTTDPETGKPIESIFEQLLKSAEEMRNSGVTVSRAENIEYPLDKVNDTIWNLLEKDTEGQISLKVEKTGSKKQLNIFYAIDFDDLDDTGIKITKHLTAFDKRVYIAISALFNAGNNIISLTQVYYAMGNTKTPDKTAREKINSSITKMMGAKIYVDNSQEAKSYNYPKFIYDGVLLPVERVTEIINGKTTDAAIHIFREPPVITFAKQRKQITTIEVKMLQSPVSKTEQNLLIEDYLIERICRAKNGTEPTRILYDTICDKAKLTTAKQRQRLPGKVKKYLDYYEECKVISGYSTDKAGVTVTFAEEIADKKQTNCTSCATDLSNGQKI